MANNLKTVAIVQARMGSTRLPGKVMAETSQGTLISFLLSRLKRAAKIDQIVVATTTSPLDDKLVAHIDSLGFKCYRGSEHDVLKRYVGAALDSDADVVVRITADCPLIDPSLVDKTIDEFLNSDCEYFRTSSEHYPDGLDTEITYRTCLEEACRCSTDKYDHEHVMPYLYRSGKFKCGELDYPTDLSHMRWTVDEEDDLKLVRFVIDKFSPETNFGWEEVVELSKEFPEAFAVNMGIQRDEGAGMNTGQKLWRRAKKVIPGGNMLLSKRPEMFLPEKWPSYYSKAKGCEVWDLDGNRFIDMSIMGVGANVLGYGHPEVDEAVHRAVDSGVMATLNAPEEVLLAEKLVEIHPWADMVRFARSGGEANAIAIRIARAAAGKDGVAICGYHGWHDWYLSANISDTDNLDNHLLQGLSTAGVPSNLRGTVHPFGYNDLSALESIIESKDIGVIKMEVMRNFEPENNFLAEVRKLASENGVVLVFDECTSGFRQNFGGLHMEFGVEPDMAVFGKAIGNGYAITSVIGRREVMEAAQSTFISSTFWTERIGPSAALKTLEVMERDRTWEHVLKIGNQAKSIWAELSSRYDLQMDISGITSMPGFEIKTVNWAAYKTYLTQEMLKSGLLATDCLYACTAHNDNVLTIYAEALDRVFSMFQKFENGDDVFSCLEGPVCHSRFERLN
jgi:glutamate-1-semialdehyde 2,1-aminomutase